VSLIDTHAHLYMKQYANNISSIIKESEKAGVEKIIVPSSSPESLEQVLNLSNEHANVFGALGIHLQPSRIKLKNT